MLPLIYREALMKAAEFGEKDSTERLERINEVTTRLKELVPQFFYMHDKDPALKVRVFQNQPRSAAWSGTAVTAHNAWLGKTWSVK
jgi:hypothetical protein